MKLSKKWYLVYDGKTYFVTNDIEGLEFADVVIVKISANQAANILALEKSERD